MSDEDFLRLLRGITKENSEMGGSKFCWRLRWAGFRLSIKDDYSKMAWHIRLRVDFAWFCRDEHRRHAFFTGI